MLFSKCSGSKFCTEAGDFNLNLNRKCSETTQEFVGLFNSKMLFCVTTKQKRVTTTSATTLDHIWINEIHNKDIKYFDIEHFPISSTPRFQMR